MAPARRLALLIVLAAALFARGLAPAGWMPGTNAAGGIELALCNGMAGETVVVAPDGRIEHKKADHGRADHPCAFAGLGVVDTAPPSFAFAARPSPTGTTPVIAAIHRAPGRGLAAPPPPPTGPPAFA